LNGKQSSAFWGFIHVLREMGKRRPPLVMLENVVGFLMSHGGKDLEEALLALNKLDYAVDAVILNAVHWVPQSRARLFVIGRRDDGSGRQTLAIDGDSRPSPLTEFIFANQHISWDIQSLPPLPKATSRLGEIVEDLPDQDAHWWSAERTEYFMNQLSPRHAA